MKAKYEYYPIGSDVYVICEHFKNNKPTPYVAIFNARVKSINIERSKKTGEIEIHYWVETPSGEEWGSDVHETLVSSNFNKLVERMKPIWEAASNTHE